ncbi:MAG TPA: hypothetical protein PLD25_30035 [Chloroflexota bacterium]|nr:hypothetical protein [Chloroflexota bacterium]HUM69126.1 hypothetical protein [Chloroflexota bacterium]
MISLIVHINNEDAVVCEMEDMPETNSAYITLLNPRLRDGSDLHYLDENVTSMMLPWHRINFVQILPSAETEDVIGFVRD